MFQKAETLVLEHLRAIRGDIGLIRDDVREVKSRLVNVESGIAGLKREAAGPAPSSLRIIRATPG